MLDHVFISVSRHRSFDRLLHEGAGAARHQRPRRLRRRGRTARPSGSQGLRLRTAGSSSGCAGGRSRVARRTSASSRSQERRSMRLTTAAMAAGATDKRRARRAAVLRTRATTPRTFWIPTDTTSNSSTRAGSIEMKTLMIYGATGYTGSVAAEQAKAARISPSSLQDAAKHRSRELASKTRCRVTACSVWTIQMRSMRALSGMSVLLNCAGPFMRTVAPIMRGRRSDPAWTISTSTAELDGYRLAEEARL